MEKAIGAFRIAVDPHTVEPFALDPAGPEPGTDLPRGKVGKPYREVITVNGGKLPFKLEPVTGLAPGLTATLEGNKVVISGTPTTAGAGVFDVVVEESQASATQVRTFTNPNA